jgi:dTDP-4-amino-4,6-dideoxygalactose transaminase
MEVRFVNLRTQYQSIKQEIDLAVQSVFESGQFVGGRFVREFESQFAALLEVTHCVGVGNGTDAILIALKSLGVSSGDEVITPAFGWISASEMITLAGGKPVFADVLPDTYTLDPALVEACITPRTKGIVVIHLYGQAAHAHRLKEICERHNLFLIEDCAQAHLTKEHGVTVGNIGDAGTFSFYPTKNLGAYGDAGCIITRHRHLEQHMRNYANHGGLHVHNEEGINSRLDPLQAAILKIKSAHLAQWTQERLAHSAHYDQGLAGVAQIDRPVIRQNTTHTFHQYVIRTQRRDPLKAYLADHQIQTMVHYPKALPNLPAYQYMGHTHDDFPVASRVQDEVLSLPVYPELTSAQIDFVVDKIKGFF